MYKVMILPCSIEAKPGQKAHLKFCNGEIYVPILDYQEQHIWLVVPKSLQKCQLDKIVGSSFKAPGNSRELIVIPQCFYFDLFFWAKYWSGQINAPLLIHLPERVSWGKIVPSRYIDSHYSWFSQYIASIEELDLLEVPNRVVSDHYPHAMDLSQFDLIKNYKVLQYDN